MSPPELFDDLHIKTILWAHHPNKKAMTNTTAQNLKSEEGRHTD
jgi:hypothetical protein